MKSIFLHNKCLSLQNVIDGVREFYPEFLNSYILCVLSTAAFDAIYDSSEIFSRFIGRIAREIAT